MIKEIRDKLRELNLDDLPDGKAIVKEGIELSKKC